KRLCILFRQVHLLSGVIALLAVAGVANLIFSQFNMGFIQQLVAHNLHIWNFAGMALARAGILPGR
ncbi:MAG: YedE-related selenium metabolism membrane protein, partial [Desulfotignum sp.]